MKVLVTGVTGQLGYDCVKELGLRGAEVRGVSSKDFSLTDYEAARRYITGWKPDVVMHCAAYTAVDKAEDEKTRGELDKELHTQIAKIADNPMIYSVLAAADQLIENIGYQMIRRNWSMKTLADKADLPYETVKHLMAGKIGRPSFISILKIANALECSLDDLAGRNNPALEALRRLADHADGMYQIFAEVEHLLYPNFMMQRENNK